MTAHEILDKAADEINATCPKASATYNKTRDDITLSVTNLDTYKHIFRATIPIAAPERVATHTAIAARLMSESVLGEGAVAGDSMQEGGAE